MDKIIIIFGTRPELIKLAPVIDEFTQRGQRSRLHIVNSGQHHTMTTQDMEYFGIQPDYTFTLPRNDDSLLNLHGQLLLEFYKMHNALTDLAITPIAVIAQGDTCTSFCSAQYAFYEHIPFAHVEAGLRTHDFSTPFPEEYYRKTISSLASIHFAPTSSALTNLLDEGITPASIFVTGNTAIDNLRKYAEENPLAEKKRNGTGKVLITIHRRENIKENLPAIIDRVNSYCEKYKTKTFLWLDNPGYKIKTMVNGHHKNLSVVQPVSFSEMIRIYRDTDLIITDSGGIQEEACYLGIPSLIYRSKTERTESITEGISKYISDFDEDLDIVMQSLNGNRRAGHNTLYGDGYASKMIVDTLVSRGMI